MKTLVPNYYSAFACIADKCEHSCCVGWDISIDKDTLKYYSSIGGLMGKKLSDCISSEGSFVTDDKRRCPFLNDGGLCDIITELGEGALCTICREHPRFYNSYSDFDELGIGICCQEACRIILNFKEPFAVIGLENADFTEEEQYFFALRQSVFDILQDRNISILNRVENLAGKFGFSLSDISLKDVCTLLLSLEKLDDAWGSMIGEITNCNYDFEFLKDANLQIAFEQLLCYFVYRHFNMEKGNYYEAVCFACTGFLVVGALCANHLAGGSTLRVSDAENYARMFSSEIEYCPENTEAVMEYFE